MGQDSIRVNQDSEAVQTNTYLQKSDSLKKKSKTQLQEFRKAFRKLVNSKRIKQKKKVESDPSLDLGVIILDETRTRMGRDFYSLFYQNWQPPKNSANSTITISEQPSPGLGSIVSIKINYKKVYQARLQPRYTYIEAVSKQAVGRCQYIIKQEAKVRKQLTGY